MEGRSEQEECLKQVGFSGLTPAKLECVLSFRSYSKEDVNYYSMYVLDNVTLAVEEIFAKIKQSPSSVQLFLFLCSPLSIASIKTCRKLTLILKIDNQIEQLVLHKLVKYATKKIVARDLKSHKDQIVQRMYSAIDSSVEWKKREYTFVYCDVQHSTLSVDELKNNPLLENPLSQRIDLDASFGQFNEQEALEVYGVSSVLQIVENLFTHDYTSLDFESLLDVDKKCFTFKNANYRVDLNFWDGSKYYACSDSKDADRVIAAQHCIDLLYKPCKGTQIVHSGFVGRLKFDNYFLLLRHPEFPNKTMYLFYEVDDSTCAGFCFCLKSRLRSSLANSWNSLTSAAQCQILSAKKEKHVLPSGKEDSDSEPDMWASFQDYLQKQGT